MPPLVPKELPPGVYSAERGRSKGGLNEDVNPSIGAGGRNVDCSLSGGVVVDGSVLVGGRSVGDIVGTSVGLLSGGGRAIVGGEWM